MSRLATIRDFLTWADTTHRPMQADERAVPAGVIDADPSSLYWGIDDNKFTPPEYGEYVATSNGVYACVMLRAKALSGLPIDLFRRDKLGDLEVVESHPARDLLNMVNPFWTATRLIEMTEVSLGLWGEAYWIVERGQSGTARPREIWWVNPTRMKVVPHETEYIAGYLYEPATGGEPIPYATSEVIRFFYPNPLDEFTGLSPLAAARLAADTSSAAMHSNYNIFRNGVQMSGVVSPGDKSTIWTEAQARELEGAFERRFKGADRAHRLGVMRQEVNFTSLSMTPQDAEFLGALKWSLEDICRAYGVPLDLIGGERTYENVSAADRALWQNALKPESRFIAGEITEQLLPMFGSGLVAQFDLSEVDALHESETERWMRDRERISQGAITINEWRAEQGFDPVAWGDAFWQTVTNVPTVDAEPPVMATSEPVSDTDDDTANSIDTPGRTASRHRFARAIEYGGDEHRVYWQRLIEQTEPWEKRIADTTIELMYRQRQAVLSRLRSRGARIEEDVALEPFDRGRWIKAFRVETRPVLESIIEESGQLGVDEIGIQVAFNVNDPRVVRFLEQRAQRFAERVNDTTWRTLKASLSEGIAAGEDIPKLAKRVDDVMGERIRSTPTVIARTETIGASNGGRLEGWRQTGVVERKQWIAAIDDRTRGSHIAAHGQEVGIDEDFSVGAGHGPMPGQIGIAREDIQCRCTAIPITDIEASDE